MKSSARSRKRPYRARKTIYELPPLELECMKVLWALTEARPADGASVREIREALRAVRRPLAYTTVETIMDRLTAKGVVERRKQGRAHRYTPVYQKQEARTQAVAALVEHFFSGSRRALLAHLEGGPVREPVQLVARPSVASPPAVSRSRGSAARRSRSERPARRAEPVRGAADSPIDTSLL